MKTVTQRVLALDQDLYVRAVARWQAENGPREPASLRRLSRPYLKKQEHRSEPERAKNPYTRAYIVSAVCAVIAIGLVLLSLRYGA